MPKQGGRSFPGGLVLGLTMAETVILIVFVLLLAMTVLLGRETDLREDVEKKLAQLESMQGTLDELGLSPEAARDVLASGTRDRHAAENWRTLLRALDEESDPRTAPSPEAVASRMQAHETLTEALRETGIKGITAVPDAMTTLAEIAKISHAAGLTLADAKERIAVPEVGDGRGTDHPSCWTDNDNTVAYLFDVALVDGGYILQPARAPQHEHKRASLPLSRIRTGRLLSPTEFREQTRAILDWSVANECRFFVRAFDLTAPDQKEVYKDRMRTLESRFYKNASPSGPPPSVDTVLLRR